MAKNKIRYVDMCIYIDNHIYNGDYDEQLVFDYLQKLFYALSYKKNFFLHISDYQQYSLYGATHVYLRLTNKRQFLPDDDPNKLKKIKSVLNFIKSILYPLKVNYQHDEFNRMFVDEIQGEGINDSIKQDLVKRFNSATRNYTETDVENYLSTLHRVIRTSIQDQPYSNDKVFMKRLYLSCLITFIRSITLSNSNKERLRKRENGAFRSGVEDLTQKLYMQEALLAPVVWKLPKEYETLVAVLCNKIREQIAKDIRSLSDYYEPSEYIMEDILMAPLADLSEDSDD